MQQDTNSDWFAASIQQPYPAAPPPRRRWLRKLLLVGGIAILLIGGGAAGIYFLRPTCLTAADYQQLAGAPYEGQLDARSAFYTTLIYFQTNKATYDNTDSQGEAQLKSFATFYQSHASASIVFTLSATYPEDIYRTLTEQRLASAKQSLISMGVPEDKIVTDTPTQITPEEPIDEDGATVGSHNAIAVSITSLEGCR